MPQPTTAEVRLDEHKAASFGPAGGHLAVLAFNESAAIEFSLPRNPQGRKIATNTFGIREMSVERNGYAVGGPGRRLRVVGEAIVCVETGWSGLR